MTVEEQRRRELRTMNWLLAATVLAAVVSWGSALFSLIRVFCR